MAKPVLLLDDNALPQIKNGKNNMGNKEKSLASKGNKLKNAIAKDNAASQSQGADLEPPDKPTKKRRQKQGSASTESQPQSNLQQLQQAEAPKKKSSNATKGLVAANNHDAGDAGSVKGSDKDYNVAAAKKSAQASKSTKYEIQSSKANAATKSTATTASTSTATKMLKSAPDSRIARNKARTELAPNHTTNLQTTTSSEEPPNNIRKTRSKKNSDTVNTTIDNLTSNDNPSKLRKSRRDFKVVDTENEKVQVEGTMNKRNKKAKGNDVKLKDDGIGEAVTTRSKAKGQVQENDCEAVTTSLKNSHKVESERDLDSLEGPSGNPNLRKSLRRGGRPTAAVVDDQDRSCIMNDENLVPDVLDLTESSNKATGSRPITRRSTRNSVSTMVVEGKSRDVDSMEVDNVFIELNSNSTENSVLTEKNGGTRRQPPTHQQAQQHAEQERPPSSLLQQLRSVSASNSASLSTVNPSISSRRTLRTSTTAAQTSEISNTMTSATTTKSSTSAVIGKRRGRTSDPYPHLSLNACGDTESIKSPKTRRTLSRRFSERRNSDTLPLADGGECCDKTNNEANSARGEREVLPRSKRRRSEVV
jgi:hypothetical protein